MRRSKPENRNSPKQLRLESEEIELLKQWIESGKPVRGSNSLLSPLLSPKSPIGRLPDGTFSTYAGCNLFRQLPLSKKTKDGLKHAGYIEMMDIQRASLPHSLCGRDILGAAERGSGETLAFVIPVLEKLHQARWRPEDGLGCIILSPTTKSAIIPLDILTRVGSYHSFRAGLIGGPDGVGEENEHVNGLNILVCTPKQLLQHMNATPNFECSKLQTLVLDKADRILQSGSKEDVDTILAKLPKARQTFLFSKQRESVEDLAKLSLKDPEDICAPKEAVTAKAEDLEISHKLAAYGFSKYIIGYKTTNKGHKGSAKSESLHETAEQLLNAISDVEDPEASDIIELEAAKKAAEFALQCAHRLKEDSTLATFHGDEAEKLSMNLIFAAINKDYGAARAKRWLWDNEERDSMLTRLQSNVVRCLKRARSAEKSLKKKKRLIRHILQ